MGSAKTPLRKRRGAGRVTLTEVAHAADVSAISVSRFFNQPEQVSQPLRERIQAAVETLGYVPNRVAGGLTEAAGPGGPTGGGDLGLHPGARTRPGGLRAP